MLRGWMTASLADAWTFLRRGPDYVPARLVSALLQKYWGARFPVRVCSKGNFAVAEPGGLLDTEYPDAGGLASTCRDLLIRDCVFAEDETRLMGQDASAKTLMNCRYR